MSYRSIFYTSFLTGTQWVVIGFLFMKQALHVEKKDSSLNKKGEVHILFLNNPCNYNIWCYNYKDDNT